MPAPTPAVTNTTSDRAGMTLTDMIRFVTDCLKSPTPVDQHRPLQVRTTVTGRILTISAPREDQT